MRAIYFCLAIAFAVVVHAEIKTQAIEYKAGEVTLKGVLVYDDAQSSRRPGIVIYPEWWGLTEYPIHRARMLAKLGYVAFAADMYGQGKTTDDPQQAGQWIGQLKQNRAMLLERARAAVETPSWRAVALTPAWRMRGERTDRRLGVIVLLVVSGKISPGPSAVSGAGKIDAASESNQPALNRPLARSAQKQLPPVSTTMLGRLDACREGRHGI